MSSSNTISRFRGDTYPIRVTVLQDGSPVDITSFSFLLTVSREENPTSLFSSNHVTGTLGAGTDTDTAASTGAFADSVAGDLFHNVTKGKFAFIQTVTSDNSVELDREIAAQASGNSFETGVSSQVFQIAGTLTTPLEGIVDFPFTVAEANNVGAYFYDIQAINADSKVVTLRKGRIVFHQDLTK